MVGASGNAAAAAVAYPARSSDVLSVGATTAARLPGRLLQRGLGPRPRRPRRRRRRRARRRPELPPARTPRALDIFQMTFTDANGTAASGCRAAIIGTSMAAPHVSATAALVVASGILGPNPTPGRDRAPAGDDRARPRPARQGPALRLRACSTPPRATDPAIPTSSASRPRQVVLMIRTEQGAWWETLFGTEPSRKRRAPVMPLLPTTIRSASRSSATSRIASAGSPSRAKVSTVDARLAHRSAASRASRRRPRAG